MLDSLHEEIGNPESEEEISRSNFFLSVILSEIEEFENVGMPGFDVDGECSRSLVSSLIDVSSGVVEDSEHGDDSIGVTVRSSDVGSGSTNVVNAESDSTGGLGDEGAGLEGVVDTVDRIVLHGNEETRGELRSRSTGVEEGGGSVGEASFGHEGVRLKGSLDVLAVNSNGDSHEHVLRSFRDFTIDSEKVGSLESLESKVVLFVGAKFSFRVQEIKETTTNVAEITIVNDGRVDLVGVGHDDLVSVLGDHSRRSTVLGVDWKAGK